MIARTGGFLVENAREKWGVVLGLALRVEPGACLIDGLRQRIIVGRG